MGPIFDDDSINYGTRRQQRLLCAAHGAYEGELLELLGEEEGDELSDALLEEEDLPYVRVGAYVLLGLTAIGVLAVLRLGYKLVRRLGR